MGFSQPDRYVSLLIDFGFKRVFGSEPNKRLLIDFLNTLLPDYHHIRDVTFKNLENLGATILDRKAIIDVYCEAENGDCFIVELQRAKQNFFQDRSVYYASFPIQEEAQKGEWSYELTPVYLVGILDFVFDDHKNDPTFLHIIQLKDDASRLNGGYLRTALAQECRVVYDKLKFIYIELPKFKKTLEQLETHFDKWLFLFRHLPQLYELPQNFQEEVFEQLFEVAEIANFSRDDNRNYQASLKVYRDWYAIEMTARQEAMEQGRREGRQQFLILRLLTKKLGELDKSYVARVYTLSLEQLELLSVALFDFSTVADLDAWLLGLE